MATDPGLASGFFKNIEELWFAEEFSDLKISIKNHQFSCHKFHLCACSAFLKVLLRSESEDSVENFVSHMIIKGISPDTFALVLKSVYKAENGLNESNMIEMWHAACKLQIDILTAKCEDFVIGQLSLENYLNIFLSAILLDSARVLEAVLKFMAENFETIRHTQTFLQLPVKFVQNIIGNDSLRVESRDHVVESIVQWAMHIPESNSIEENSVRTRDFKGRAMISATDLQPQTGNTDLGHHQQSCRQSQSDERQKIEVIFCDPPRPVNDESTSKLLQDASSASSKREEAIGQLLKIANLKTVSTDCLETLQNNDWLMTVKQARDILWETLSSQSRAEGSANCVPEQNKETKPQLVMISRVRNSTYHAYSLEANRRYGLQQPKGYLLSYGMCTYRTPPIYIDDRQPKERMANIYHEDKEVMISGLPDGTTFLGAVGEYLYCAVEKYVYQRLKVPAEEKEKAWTPVTTMKVKGTLSSRAVLNDKILLLCTYAGSIGYPSPKITYMYCFNTRTCIFHFVMELEYPQSSYCHFFNKGQLYIIGGQGILWEVQESLRSTIILRRCDACLWNDSIELHGAFVHNKRLIIFVDLPLNCHLPTPTPPLGLQIVEFVQMLTWDRCYPVVVPRNWLTEKIEV